MIKCKNLTLLDANGNEIFKKISLNIESGKIAVVIGLKGSGKTTLLDCISGHANATGEIYTKNSRYLKELPSFCEQLTGIEYVEMLLTLISQRNKEEIFKLIENLFIHKELSRPISEVGIYTRKVLILISSFCLESDSIIVDEPFTHFDYQSQKIIVEIIKKLKKQGKTLLIATNEMDLGFEISDEIVLLKNGKVKQIKNKFNSIKHYEGKLMSLLMH